MKWEKFIQAGVRLPYYMNLYIMGKLIDSPKIWDWKSSHWLVQTEKQLTTVYFNPEEIELAREWLKKNITNNRFLENFPTVILQIENRLLNFSRLLYFKNFENTSNQNLAKILNYFSLLFRAKFGIYSLPKIIDEAFTKLLSEVLSSAPTKEDYIALIETNELSDYQKERISHLKIVKKIIDNNLQELFNKTNAEIIEETGRFHPNLYYQIEKYTKNFAWLTTSHHVQPMNLDKAVLNVKDSLKDATSLTELENLLQKNNQTIEKQNLLIKKYRLDAHDLKIIKFLCQINHFNETRKAGMSKALLWSYPLFQEIADRLNTDPVSLRQLTDKEITKSLALGIIPEKYQSIIAKRLEYYLCLLHQGKIYELNGEKAKKYFEENFLPTDKNLTELKGNIAQKGKAVGKARLILIEHQVEKLQEGEILIASMTDPNMLPAMKKAAAIVTDEGGITCHAAIVSRELKKPCIIATKIATKIFQDGDMIEVDAENGIVRKLN